MGENTHLQKSRHYRQRLRAESAAATRQRILEAARRCLTAAPLHNVGLDEIATEANVARSTLYTNFGSRAGLFQSVAEDVLERGGFVALQQAFRDTDALTALEQSLTEGVRLYAAEYAVGRALLSLAAVDRDAAGAAERLNRGRSEGMMDLATRLEQQHFLRSDVKPQEAADVLWVLTSFETFDQLYSDRGLSSQQVSARLITTAKRSLCHQEIVAASK